MRFTVPQFIEYEAKIVGPLTFKQFIYIGLAGAICFVLYFSVPFFVFFVSSIVLGIGGMAFAFLKVGGRSLPGFVANFLMYNLTPKMYIWRKKKQAPAFFQKEKQEEEKEEELPLKISGKSRLKNLRTKIETKKSTNN